MKRIIHLLITATTLLLIDRFIDGITVESFYIALLVALILGILNVTVKPILILLTLPLTLVTLGLFTFVINALIFWFLASFVEGFSVTGFLPAFVGALILSAVSTVAHKFL